MTTNTMLIDTAQRCNHQPIFVMWIRCRRDSSWWRWCRGVAALLPYAWFLSSARHRHRRCLAVRFDPAVHQQIRQWNTLRECFPAKWFYSYQLFVIIRITKQTRFDAARGLILMPVPQYIIIIIIFTEKIVACQRTHSKLSYVHRVQAAGGQPRWINATDLISLIARTWYSFSRFCCPQELSGKSMRVIPPAVGFFALNRNYTNCRRPAADRWRIADQTIQATSIRSAWIMATLRHNVNRKLNYCQLVKRGLMHSTNLSADASVCRRFYATFETPWYCTQHIQRCWDDINYSVPKSVYSYSSWIYFAICIGSIQLNIIDVYLRWLDSSRRHKKQNTHCSNESWNGRPPPTVPMTVGRSHSHRYNDCGSVQSEFPQHGSVGSTEITVECYGELFYIHLSGNMPWLSSMLCYLA